MSTIKVSRAGEKRTFDKKVWDQMPADHYGWIPAAEMPEEVKEAKEVKVLNVTPDELKAAGYLAKEINKPVESAKGKQ